MGAPQVGNQPQTPDTASFNNWPQPPPPVTPQDMPVAADITPAPAFQMPEISPQLTTPPEPAPTDLSQLTGNSEQMQPPEVYTPPVSTPENLVIAAQAPLPESLHAESKESKIPPKAILGLGVALVLIISALSAYFILGVGKPTEDSTTSVPAEQSQSSLTNPPRQQINTSQTNTATPDTTTSSSDSSGSSFGSVSGSKSATSSGSQSALDLLKQRQQATSSAR